MKNFNATVLALLIFGLTVSSVLANFAQQQKITSTPRGVGAQFGNAVAINGNTMVVGARFDSTAASQAGAAYVYVKSGGAWVQQAVLLATGGAAGDKFGYSVAISENTIVVGAFNADSPLSNAGAAYVFVRSGTAWSQQQKLTASDATADDQFGLSVAITGEVIVVGANHADLPSNSEAGAAYVFLRTGTVWAQTQRLSPSLDVLLGDHFGDSVAMGGNKIVIGASGDDTPFTSAGAVYVFVETGVANYTIQQKLTIPDGTNGDQFGFSVAFDGTTLVGGATEDTPIVGQPAFGCAYVFTQVGGTWTQQQKLTASDGATVDRFGYSVAVLGDTVVVGAREDDTAVGGDAGSAYVFTRAGSVWTQQQKIGPSDTFNGDRFGGSAAFASDGSFVVGAAEKNLTSPNGQGAVYAFALIHPNVRADFDGDGLTDLSIFRPSEGAWYAFKSAGGVLVQGWGIASDIPTPGDYDGDGKADTAIFRQSSGQWYILRSSDSTANVIAWGVAGDKPVQGDYDGDGKTDVAQFRPSQGVWYVFRSSDNGVTITTWGSSSDLPVPADYDADGKTDTAIYRPSTGQWYVLRSLAGVMVVSWGASGDKPVPADYDGDGKDDVSIYRPASGTWFTFRSSDSGVSIIAFGISTDLPIPGDYDGDGTDDIAVFRNGTWYVNRSTGGFYAATFGIGGDLPIPSKYIP